MIKVIKKDGTKEEFNVQKVIVAVNGRKCIGTDKSIGSEKLQRLP